MTMRKIMWKRVLLQKHYGIFQSFRDLNVCLPMLMMQKTSHGMQMEKKIDGLLRHVVDSPQLKKIFSLYPEFGSDPRNLRLALATDGINPYGNLSNKYSLWPVLVIIYKLSCWLCMKRKFMMLSKMISGPWQPENETDVYLSPLIEYLRFLWDQRVEIFDAYENVNFNLCALLFAPLMIFQHMGIWAITVLKDIMLARYVKRTSYHQLKHRRKTSYIRQWRFLKHNHLYRRLKKAFNGSQEDKIAPPPLTGKEVATEFVMSMWLLGKYKRKTLWKTSVRRNLYSLNFHIDQS